MKPMINIGVEKQTVTELRKAIMDILNLHRGDDVTLKALDVLFKGAEVSLIAVFLLMTPSIPESYVPLLN